LNNNFNEFYISPPKKERKRDFTKVVHYKGDEVAKCKNPLKERYKENEKSRSSNLTMR